LTDLNPRPRALRLDLAGVSHLDSAALGLLALLRGHQVTHHQPLVFVGASPALRRRLAHFGAGYLLEPLTPAERR
jgi:anti-anti-sigma regulatory factor